ncbi:MAG: DUF4209 domain-containing protein [Prevotellaceae bacterium]|nr:DUF4209 domain-containing protein [Prevotellaceae bacterium]
MKKDEQESAILCEFERQILFINKSFEYKKDEAKGTVNGLSYMFAGTQTLEDGLEIPIYFPDVAKLTKSDFEYCEKRYKECNNLFMKTEYGLMVYFGRQTDYSKRNDFKSKLCNELFTLAKYYLVKVINDCENKYYNMDFLYTLKLAFGIAENNRLTNEINTLVEFSFDTHQNSNINKNGMIKIILDISCLMSYNFKFFKDKIDFNKVIEKNIEVVKELEKTDLFGAEHIINGVLKIQQQMNMSQANSLRYKAEIYEKLMKDGEENRKNNLVAVKFAEDALRIYKSLNDKNKIDELGRKYNDLRGKIQLTEHFSEFPEEYTQRVIEQIDATVKQSTEQDIIYHFIITLWYMKIADIQIQAEKMRKESLLTYLATTSILDKFGNTIETYKTDEEKIQQRFWDTYRINNQLGTQKMQRLFIEAYKARKLSYKSTMNYLENTWLNEPIIRDYHSNTVEIKPIDTLKPCLKRLFSELDFWLQENDYQIDCVTITDSLTLKIEQLLRNFCEKIGISTFKLRVKGGDNLVMEKLLDDILSDIKHSEENRTNFDEEDRIFIKYVLTEKSGLNLRNRIAHGLMDINEYSFENILLLFSIIMKLSKYKFTPITT